VLSPPLPATKTTTTSAPKASNASVNTINNTVYTTEKADATNREEATVAESDVGGEIQQQPPKTEAVSDEPLLADLSRGAKVLRSGQPTSPPPSTQSSSPAALTGRQSQLASSASSVGARSADDGAWERSRISVRVRTTTTGPPPLAAAGTRGSRRDDGDSGGDSDERSTAAAAAGQQQRGRVRLHSSVLGSFQKAQQGLSPLAAVRGEGISSSGGGAVRPGVGASAAALRAERVRFKVR
jgi:hypothetical protein